jgi:hypothetical protein
MRRRPSAPEVPVHSVDDIVVAIVIVVDVNVNINAWYFEEGS